MLEGIRTKVYVRIQQNKSKSANWSGRICPNIPKKLNKYIDLARHCQAIKNVKDGFEVMDKTRGIPCPHAITALFVSSKQPKDYIADCYSVEQYNRLYDHCMMPMEGMMQWSATDHAKSGPPGYVKMPRRPRKERREPGEAKKASKMSKVGTKGRCSKCKKTVHNIRRCPMTDAGKKRNILERAKEVQECSRLQKRSRKLTLTSQTTADINLPSQSSINIGAK